MFFKKKEVKELEQCIRSIQMNLENNYKDLAISYLHDAEKLYAQYCEAGRLNDKERISFGKTINGYQQRMKGYSHTDISKFLHEVL